MRVPLLKETKRNTEAIFPLEKDTPTDLLSGVAGKSLNFRWPGHGLPKTPLTERETLAVREKFPHLEIQWMVAKSISHHLSDSWKDDSPVNTNKQWLQPWCPSGAKWTLSIHSEPQLGGVLRRLKSFSTRSRKDEPIWQPGNQDKPDRAFDVSFSPKWLRFSFGPLPPKAGIKNRHSYETSS